MASRDVLPDLAAELAHRLQQTFVGITQLTGEELHHADDPAWAEQRKPERGMQPGPAGDRRPREVPVLRGVDDPHRLARRDHPPGRPSPGASVIRSLSASNSGRTVARVPDAAAAQPIVAGSDLPDRAQLPAERGPDRLENRCVRLDRPIGLRQDSGDGVLHSLEITASAMREPTRPVSITTMYDTRRKPASLDRSRVTDEQPLRVVVADDSALLREGIASLLEDAGHQVVGRSGAPDELLLKVRSYDPDVAIVDVRMPPGNADDGLVAAVGDQALASTVAVSSSPSTSSPTTCSSWSATTRRGRLPAQGPGARRRRVHRRRRARRPGGTAFDPEVVKSLVDGHRRSALDDLTERERSVLALVAEGRSNRAIAKQLYLSSRAVERHVQAIFQKLGLPDTEDDNRRVLAVLALLGR